MKILYIVPSSKRIDHWDTNKKEYDFPEISQKIAKDIKGKFSDVEIDYVFDAIPERDTPIIEEVIVNYDLTICDITTSNPSIAFVAGVIETLKKPVIYISSHECKTPPIITQNNRHLKYSEASLQNEFISELIRLINEISIDPHSFEKKPQKIKERKKAFISYSHKDSSYLDRLLVHLKPLETQGLIDVWQDKKINAGDKWADEIEKALETSNVAVLLISADFMASEFIVNNELPPLLIKAEVQGTKIIPVILSHCRFSRDKNLSIFQAVNPPSKPLSIMTESEREAIYDKIATEIEELLK